MFSGKTKLAVCQRLVNDWRDLADYFDMRPDQRQGFTLGREPHGVWEWLEAQNRLDELPEALTYIGRADVVHDVLQPPPTSTPTAETAWQGSPFPGLRYFTPDDAPIFFGRTRETDGLLERLRHACVARGTWLLWPGARFFQHVLS